MKSRDEPLTETQPSFDSSVDPAVDDQAGADREPVPGDVEGYRILKLIGQGGMGEVWEAEQVGAVRRRVAIKEIKRGMDSVRIVDRFEGERQALAMMDHPAIARIFDAGLTQDHRPYFAMEFVEGLPITDFCDRHRLGLRERIDLFVQVCRGVQHAHLKGIVHRDLKPTNVLVTLQDGEPVPKVIDFGLAKAMREPLTEREMQTELGQTLGTMEYMSPEQADLVEADIDTRTDVYSLGVLLYELLAGTLPFTTKELSSGGYFQALRRIREDEPLRPSRKLASAADADEDAASRGLRDAKDLARRLEGDLDWIVMMALEKDRSRRYETVNALVADLQRHLGDEPVVAASPTVRYRVEKFIRRHRVGFVSSTLLILLVLGFSVAMALQASRIAEERDRANLEARTAKESLDFLVELFEAVRPDEGMGDTVTARQILDVGRDQLDRLDDQPLVRARLLDTVGAVYLSLGLEDEAAPLIESALAIRDRELGRPSKEVAESLRRLAMIHDNLGDYEQAERLAREALRMLDVETVPVHQERAESLRVLGWTLQRRGEYTEAEEVFREAIQTRRSASEDADVRFARCLFGLATVLARQGRYDEANSLLDEALTIFEGQLGSKHIMVRTILNLRGYLARAEGRIDEAEAFMRQALAITESVLGRDSSLLASDLTNLAVLVGSRGRLDEAESLARQALETYERSVGPEHKLYGTGLGNLAWINYQKKEYGRAEELYERTLAIYRETLAPTHPSMAIVQQDYAAMLFDEGRYRRALEMIEAALGAHTKSLGETHPTVADCVRLEAQIHHRLGETAVARSLLEQALEIFTRTRGPEHPEAEKTRQLLSELPEEVPEPGGF